MTPSVSQGGRALALGSGLRPIVFGPTKAALAFLSKGGGNPPELTLSVHAAGGQLLGYAVVDRTAPRPAWGGLTAAPDLSLDDACVLARATTLQLRLFAIPRGSHHCLLSVAGAALGADGVREAYREALQPLLESDLCRIVFTVENGSWQPALARNGLIASGVASTLTVLTHVGVDATVATVALHRPTELARQVAAALARHGVRVLESGEGEDVLTRDADVVLVDGALWALDLRDALRTRARAVVSLAALVASPAAERRLHERGVLLVPDTLAAAGRLVALDLHGRGVDERSANERTFAAVRERLYALLEIATGKGEALAETVRACADVTSSPSGPAF